MVTTMKILLVIMIIALCICYRVTSKGKIESKSSLLRLYVCEIAVLLSYLAFLFSRTKSQALFFNGLYYAGNVWYVILFFMYITDYTKVYRTVKRNDIIVTSLAMIDTCAMLLNNIWQFIFDLTLYVDYKNDEVVWLNIFKSFRYLHVSFYYIILIFSLILLIYKIHKTPKMYKGAYLSLLALLFGAMFTNTICVKFKLNVDISVLVYALLTIVLCYLSLLASPKAFVNKMLSCVAEEMQDGMICYDISGNIVYINKLAKLLFYDEENRDYEKNIKDLNRLLKGKSPIECEPFKNQKIRFRINNEERHYIVDVMNMVDRGEKAGIYLKVTDNTSEMNDLEKERYRATYDELTGIYNRESFFKEADRVLKEDPYTPRYMIASDIKDFKLINQFFGEKFGDEILKKVAVYLRKLSHRGNVYGRISGDKFALLMPCKYFSEEIFIRVLKSMQSLTDEGLYKMHIYAGVYPVSDYHESAQAMYDKAQLTIDSVKGNYQKVFIYYDEEIMKRLVYQNTVISEFSDAINNKQFEMYLQPQVDGEGKIVGAEAFPCWIHPVRGVLTMDRFYSILEKTGHVYLLDTLVWEKAIKRLAKWKKNGREDLFISINISAKDMFYVNVYDVLTKYIEMYDVNPKNLKVEIKETSLMDNIYEFMELFDELQKYGFDIEIDDFGLGYSSLNMLKDINADYLKLDVGFLDSDTDGIWENDDEEIMSINDMRSRIIFKSVVDMASELGMNVIIDGVSGLRQASYIEETGGLYFQGDYFHKMISGKEFDNQFINS